MENEKLLTTRQYQVATLYVEGNTQKEIAATLGIAPKTVGTTISNLYIRLGIHSKEELAKLMLSEQLLRCPSCGSQKVEVRSKVIRFCFLMRCPDKFHGDTYEVPKDGNEIALKNFLNSLDFKVLS